MKAIVSSICLFAVCLAATALANDPYYQSSGSWQQSYADQWALRALLNDSAPEPTAGAGVVVAILDTGVDYRHEDFPRHALWRNPAEVANGRDDDGNGYVDDLIGWNFVSDDNNPFDQSGHGTHVAGLIAACTGNDIGIAGASPGVTVMALKVASFSGRARARAVAEAIDYAAEHGAHIINLSLGAVSVSDLERAAVNRALQAGVLLVASAGNDASRTSPFGYGAVPGVLSVGASDISGERAGFSPAGASLDLLAPGVDLLSLRAGVADFIAQTARADYKANSAAVGEPARYYRASGTSFATALVTAVAARAKAARPALSAEQVAAVLRASATDVAIPGIDLVSGYGRVDLAQALVAEPAAFVDLRVTGVDVTQLGDQVVVDLLGSDPTAAPLTVEAGVADGDGVVASYVELTSLPTSSSVVARVALADLLAIGDSQSWQLRVSAPGASATVELALPGRSASP